jgi:hypothetical protein
MRVLKVLCVLCVLAATGTGVGWAVESAGYWVEWQSKEDKFLPPFVERAPAQIFLPEFFLGNNPDILEIARLPGTVIVASDHERRKMRLLLRFARKLEVRLKNIQAQGK